MPSRSNPATEKLLDGEINDSTGFDDGPHDSATLPVIASLIASLGALGFGYTMGFTSPALPAMVGDVLQIDSCKISGNMHTVVSNEGDWFGSTANIGAMIGALMGGFLTSKLGRRGAVMFSALPYIVGWAWMALANHVWMFICTRVLCGIAVGIASMSVPMYIAEISPPRLRGALGTLNQFGVVVGITVVYAIGVVLPSETNAERWGPTSNTTSTIHYCDPSAKTIGNEWKILAWIGCGLAVAQLCFMALMPNTPRWLVSQGRDDEAMESIRRLRGPDFDHQSELQELYGNSDQEDSEASWGDLCAPGTRTPFIIALVMMVIQQCSGINGVMFYCSQIFSSAGVKDAAIAALALQGVQLVFTAVAVFLMDRAGRKVLLVCAGTGMAFFSGTMGVFFWLNKDNEAGSAETMTWLALISLIGYIIFFSIGMGAIPWLLMSEIFASKVRSKAMGLATMLNWMCSFGVTYAFPKMLATSPPISFWGFSAVCICGTIFVQLFVYETRGRTLEEIEAYFKRKAGVDILL